MADLFMILFGVLFLAATFCFIYKAFQPRKRHNWYSNRGYIPPAQRDKVKMPQVKDRSGYKTTHH